MPAAEDERHLRLTLDFCLRVGEVLLSSGAGAADVVSTMRAVGARYGIQRAEVDVTFTQLSMSVQAGPDQPAVMLVRQVTRRALDYGVLSAVDELVQDVVTGEPELAEARTRLGRILSSGHARSRWAVTTGWGVMSAGVAMLLGGDPMVAAIAAASAALIDRVLMVLGRRRLPLFYQQVAGGIVATAVATLCVQAGLHLNPSRVVTANIVMLLAGIGFMGAVQDALTGFLLTAGARFTEALLATAGIIAGVSGGLSLGGVFGLDVGRLNPGATGLGTLPAVALGSAVCAAAFGYATYAPTRVLMPVAVVAAVAIALQRTASGHGLTQAWSTAAAALLVGVLGYPVSRRVRTPPLVVVIPAIVPMLPGLAIFRGLALLNQGGPRASEGLLSLVAAASIALALASGVILGEYLAQPIARQARKVESRLAGPRLVGPLVDRTRRQRSSGPAD